MPDLIALDIEWPEVIALRLLQPPACLPADMAQIIVGPPGPPGSGGPDGAFLIVNRLSELDTDSSKAAARTNLGLQVIDGGTFN